MSRKIIDEWTDRTDLTSLQKFKLRHPEHKAKQALYQRERRLYDDEFCEKMRLANEKHRKKKALHKAAARNFQQKTKFLSASRIGQGLRRQIIMLADRGKSPADISVWYHLPMSVVNSIVSGKTLPAH